MPKKQQHLRQCTQFDRRCGRWMINFNFALLSMLGAQKKSSAHFYYCHFCRNQFINIIQKYSARKCHSVFPNMHDKMMNNGIVLRWVKKKTVWTKSQTQFIHELTISIILLLCIFLIEIHSTISHSRIDSFGNIVFFSARLSNISDCNLMKRATNCILIWNVFIHPTWLWMPTLPNFDHNSVVFPYSAIRMQFLPPPFTAAIKLSI